MRDQQTQQDIGEPQDDAGNYEAQPGSSAPASTSERRTEMQPQQDVREPQDDTGNYEAQAGSSAPAATRERQNEMQQPEGQQAEQTDTVDRSSTRMGQTSTENGAARESASNQDGSGLIHDQRWQYFAGRWDSIQAGFVDDPRRTVEQADRLVAEVIDHLSKIFRDERAKLESQWSRGGKADTEDLRIAMQRYRDFFRTLVGR